LVGRVSTLDATASGSSVDLTEDEVFSILSNRRRRFVLHALRRREMESNTDIGWLAERIAAWENGITMDELSSSQRKSAYTALQQTHLPKMDDAGIVAFDRDRGTIEATPAVEELDIYLEVVSGNEIPWHGYYLGLGTVGAALLVALWVDAFPFTALPDLAWVAFLVVALLVSAGAHAWTAHARQVGAGERPPEVGE
jgi:DNA-binding transcriptional ArsR family regulator